MRSGPDELPFRAPWHNIARLTVRRNHSDLTAPGDRTLAAWVGWGFSYFAAYSIGVNERVDRVNYQVIDGQWNFISFSYKKAQAKGVVWFSELNQIKEANIPGKQSLIQDYMRFIVRKEFGYKFFNGHLARIQLRLGDGAFLDMDGAQTLATGELKLPDEYKFKQDRKTVPLEKEKKVRKQNDKPTVIEIKKEDALGRNEYAISGWAKQNDFPSIGPWHLLYRVSIYPEKEIRNVDKPSDRDLVLFKGAGYSRFSVSHDNQEKQAFTILSCQYYPC